MPDQRAFVIIPWKEFAQALNSMMVVVGSLGGIYIGHRFSTSTRRAEWIRDRRMEELRELLVGLSDAYEVELRLYAGAVLDPEEQRLLFDGQSQSMRIIRSRVFIAIDVQDLEVEQRWATALQNHHRNLDVPELARQYNLLKQDLLGRVEKHSS